MENIKELRKKLREGVANYMQTEGCSCCRDNDGHRENEEVIAKLLNVKKYSDGSGYDFSKHKSKP